MSILLHALQVRHERRLRLLFTSPLASGAFGAPAPAYYSIVNNDGRAPSPVVQAALLVPGDTAVVELALSEPLIKGAFYTVKAEGVPALDTTVTPTPSALDLRWGVVTTPENVEPPQKDRELLLYFVDLLWNGTDFQESALGDLDRVSGTANVTKALNRGVEAGPLPWDNTYGAGARDFVDSPSVAAGTLKGAVAAQLLRDPRVKAVKVTYKIDDEKTYLNADPTLISGQPVERVSITVPNQ